jgi:hypothetical protein
MEHSTVMNLNQRRLYIWQTKLDTSSYFNEAYRMNERKEGIHDLDQRRTILNEFTEKINVK